jgi:short-subunit dehydrogenase
MYKNWRRGMKIAGKRVLITGASSGIGSALAAVLAGRGAVLALTSRRTDALQKVAAKLSLTFPGAPSPLIVPCDVSDRGSVRDLITSCVDHLGSIDILINNAGVCVYGNTERVALEDFHTVMDVNYFGSLHCMLKVVPYMKKQGEGLIVNIASVAAVHGVPYLGAYSASKAALVALGQSLRTELSEYGIKIMNVYPGYTQTDMFTNEKKVGSAHRPLSPYTPAPKVAEAIVRAIEHGLQDVILTLEGKALTVVQGLFPSFVEKAMEKMAFNLRDRQEVHHG